MKKTKALISLVLAIVLTLSVAFAFNAAAASTVKTMKSGTKYSSDVSTTKKPTLYKLTLKNASVLTFTADKAAASTSVKVYKDTAMKKQLDAYISTVKKGKTLTETVCTDAGTYYFRVYSTHKSTPTKFKITVTDAVNSANYCIGKATALKAGTTVKIAQTPKFDYPRWYKITLSKAQKIKITFNKDGNYVDCMSLLNAKGDELSRGGGKTVVTDDKLPAGTYYIRFPEMLGGWECIPTEGFGEYFTFKWS